MINEVNRVIIMLFVVKVANSSAYRAFQKKRAIDRDKHSAHVFRIRHFSCCY